MLDTYSNTGLKDECEQEVQGYFAQTSVLMTLNDLVILINHQETLLNKEMFQMETTAIMVKFYNETYFASFIVVKSRKWLRQLKKKLKKEECVETFISVQLGLMYD